jgi:hypothetical protein
MGESLFLDGRDYFSFAAVSGLFWFTWKMAARKIVVYKVFKCQFE